MTVTYELRSEAQRVDAAFIGLFGSDRCACPERHAVTGRCEVSPAPVAVWHGESVVPMCRNCADCWR